MVGALICCKKAEIWQALATTEKVERLSIKQLGVVYVSAKHDDVVG